MFAIFVLIFLVHNRFKHVCERELKLIAWRKMSGLKLSCLYNAKIGVCDICQIALRHCLLQWVILMMITYH